MPTKTPNHGYLTFADSEEPWGWRSNFEQLEIDIPIVSRDTERPNHTPHANALYIAHDTGAVYRGDGSSWRQIGSLAEETAAAELEAESSGSGSGSGGDGDGGDGDLTAQTVSTDVEGIEDRRDHVGPFHQGTYHENPSLWGVHFAAQPGLRIESVVLDYDAVNSLGNEVTIELWEATVDSTPGHPNSVAPSGISSPEYSVTKTLKDGPQRVSLGFQTPTNPTTGEYFLGVEGADVHLRRIQNWTGWSDYTSPRIDLQFSGRFNNPTTGDYSTNYYRVFDIEIGEPYNQVVSPWSTDVDEIYMRPSDPEEEFDNVSPRALWYDGPGHTGTGGSNSDGIAGAGETIFESSMNSQTEVGRFDIISNSSNISIAPDPSGENRDVVSIHTPQDAFRGADIAWGPNENIGSTSAGANDPESVYLRQHIYFPADTVMTDASGNSEGTKMGGVAGYYANPARGGTPADGESWSARLQTTGEGNGQFRLYYYVYHLGDTSGFGEVDYFNGTYSFGQWHEITLYVQMNTPGANDGILRAWMNGNQVYERTNFAFRDANHPDSGVTRAYGGYIYWGGNWGSPASQNTYFKDMTLAHGG